MFLLSYLCFKLPTMLFFRPLIFFFKWQHLLLHSMNSALVISLVGSYAKLSLCGMAARALASHRHLPSSGLWPVHSHTYSIAISGKRIFLQRKKKQDWTLWIPLSSFILIVHFYHFIRESKTPVFFWLWIMWNDLIIFVFWWIYIFIKNKKTVEKSVIRNVFKNISYPTMGILILRSF